MKAPRHPAHASPRIFTLHSRASTAPDGRPLGWSRVTRSVCFGAGVIFLNLASSLLAQIEEDRFASLLQNSPFGIEPATPPTEPTLEFRGYVSEGEETVFSLACPNDKGQVRSTWVGLYEPYADYVVRSFDQANDTVQIEYHGQTFPLKLKLNRTQLSAASGLPAITAGSGARDQTVSNPAAAEARRRRALRQASLALGQL